MKKAIPVLMVLVLLTVFGGSCLGVDDSICNAGSEVLYFPNGEVESCILKEYYDVSEYGVRCDQYGPITFYEDGTLKGCVTSDYYRYGGVITCNQYGGVIFYRSGRLAYCELADFVEMYGNKCDQLQPIYLYENGSVRACGKPL